MEVEEGGRVSIPLQSGARSGYRLRFLIRSSPRKGSIRGEVRQVDDFNAEVVYQHDPKNGLDADQFTYAVQGYETAVSARAKVNILVRPLTSQLEYRRAIFLGSIPAGLPSTAEISFSNKGKAEASFRLEAPPPWEILGATEVRVPPKDVASVTVSVVPEAVGQVDGVLRIEGDAKGHIMLSAEAFAPFEVSPPSLKIGSRQPSELSVKNVSGRALALVFSSPKGIVPLPSLLLQPNEMRRVAVNLAASGAGTGQDVLSVQNGAFQAAVPVEWSKSGAKIVFQEQGPLDLGELLSERPMQGRLTLKNVGEEQATVNLKSKGSWLVLPAEGISLELGPGQSKTIIVTGIADGSPGERRGALLAMWNSETTEMPVVASVRAPIAGPLPSARPGELAPNAEIPGTNQPLDERGRAELAKNLARDRLKILS
ncbi:MAG TPA: hypothetical protein VIS99_06415, partial [Terrimicrobiaceae bacterium]